MAEAFRFPLSDFRERERAVLPLPPSFGMQYPGDQAASLMDIRTSLVYPLCLRDAKLKHHGLSGLRLQLGFLRRPDPTLPLFRWI